MDTPLIISLGMLLGCVFGLSWFAGSDAPYVPTKSAVIEKILRGAGVKKGKKFYELGSGDGRVVLQAAMLGATAVGIEQSLIRVLYSRYKAKRLNLKTAHFIHGNVFKKKYTDADFVYIYLLPTGVAKLQDKLRKEINQKAIVITQTFHFKNWKPFKKIDLEKVGKKNKWDIKGAGNFQLYHTKG